MLATASGDQSIRIWDLSAPHPALKSTLRGHVSSVKAVKFRPYSNTELVSGAREGNIFLWDTRFHGNGPRFESQVGATLPMHLRFAYALCWRLTTDAFVDSQYSVFWPRMLKSTLPAKSLSVEASRRVGAKLNKTTTVSRVSYSSTTQFVPLQARTMEQSSFGICGRPVSKSVNYECIF